MVSPINCLVAGTGEFEEPPTNGGWDGTRWFGDEWDEDWVEVDPHGPGFPTLTWSPPPRITVSDFTVRSSGGSFITPPMDLLVEGGSVADPRIIFIDPQSTLETPINTLSLTVTGQLQAALQQNNLGKIEAQLTNLDQVSTQRNGGSGKIRVTFPEGEKAQQLYKANPNMLTNIPLEGTYTLVYFARVSADNYMEYQRFKGTFLVRFSINLYEEDSAYNTNTAQESAAYTSQPKRAGYQNYHSIISLPLSSKVQSTKLYYAEYFNGIENNKYTFFTNITPTPPLKLSYPYSELTPFDYLIDSTMVDIIKINDLVLEMSDYPYNALTTDKVIDSFPQSIKDSLSTTYTLGGTPLLPEIGTAVRKSIILNEFSNFSKRELEDLKALTSNREPTFFSDSKVENNIAAVDIILQDNVSIDPMGTPNMKLKNRLFNWQVLPEDINQRVIFKDTDGVETPIYLTNQDESITVTNYEGIISTLKMQVGNYFSAEPVDGENRLTVWSDIDKAVILPGLYKAKAAKLLESDMSMILDVSSDTSALTELNVDTSTLRQDGYFLKLDKSTITDIPSDSFLLRSTQATYDYITTGIDDYIQHRAFPYGVIYLRYDDMIFNHLEASLKATITHRDFTMDFVTPPIDKILVRELPQHLLLVPTNNLSRTYAQVRSKLPTFNTRSIRLSFSPFQDHSGLADPAYLEPVYDQGNTVNFTQDFTKGWVWNEKLRYEYSASKVSALPEYKDSTQPTTRKILPTSKLFQTLNNIKTVYGLGERDSVNTFDLYSRMKPEDFKALPLDQPYGSHWKGKFRLNKVTDNEGINKEKFVSVKTISTIDDDPPIFLPYNPNAPQFTYTKVFVGTATTADRFPTTYPDTKTTDRPHGVTGGLGGAGGGGEEQSGPEY
jgi:hypothetical protein